MTVRELVEILSALPPDTLVCTHFSPEDDTPDPIDMRHIWIEPGMVVIG